MQVRKNCVCSYGYCHISTGRRRCSINERINEQRKANGQSWFVARTTVYVSDWGKGVKKDSNFSNPYNKRMTWLDPGPTDRAENRFHRARVFGNRSNEHEGHLANVLSNGLGATGMERLPGIRNQQVCGSTAWFPVTACHGLCLTSLPSQVKKRQERCDD